MLTPLFSEGFHGTSLNRAENIRNNGFDCEDGLICFATPENPEMAHEFGIYRASQDNEAQYGIVHAEFPPTAAELWPIPLQVRVPLSPAAGIMIKSITVFELMDGGLHLPTHRQTKYLPSQ